MRVLVALTLILASCATPRSYVLDKREAFCRQVKKSQVKKDDLVFENMNNCLRSPEFKENQRLTVGSHIFIPKKALFASDVKCVPVEEVKNVRDEWLFLDHYECMNSTVMESVKKGVENKRTRKYARDRKNREIKRVKDIKGLAARKGYSSALINLAIGKKITIGMPEDLFYLSWGRPSKTNRSVSSFGVSKQLIYSGTYVYIRNGKVSSWQD